MKPSSSLIARIALLAAGWLALVGSVRGQTETILHSFGSVAKDGVNPTASLVQGTDGNFYGTTSEQGSAGAGTVFKITPQGTETILHNFPDANVPNDGQEPQAALIQGIDGNFYGTTAFGGSGVTSLYPAGQGTVFKITPQGAVTILHSFGDGSVTNDGQFPYTASLVQGTDGNFYGTTQQGGKAGSGTVFKITPQGTVTILHSFGDGSVANDGLQPFAGLIQGADGNFYGTTLSGGSTAIFPNGAGTVFKITPQGTVTILHSFGDRSVANDGFDPESGLIQGADGNFYGTTSAGGAPYAYYGGGDGGTVFEITPQGTVTILHSFGDGSVPNDGFEPDSGLIQGADGNFYGITSGGGFYGTTEFGGAGFGTVFKITPQGQETILHSFEDGTVTNDGYYNSSSLDTAGLIQGSDGNIYGTTNDGGSALFDGTVFKLTQGPPNITSALNVSGNVALPFNYQITGTNSPSSFAATGLPVDGLSISSTGLISGTPTSTGTFTVTLTLTNAVGSSTPYALTITIAPLPVPTVTSILTAYGYVDSATAFTYQTIATNNATSYSATYNGSSTLPSGLTFNTKTGLLSGTPTTAGTFPIQLTAKNSSGTSAAVTLSIQISPANAPPTPSEEYNILVASASQPQTILQAFDGNFYGVTQTGGSAGDGSVFELTVQGVVSTLYSFSGTVTDPTSLIQGADGNFYGTTTSQIFKVNPSGQLTLLHTFPGPDQIQVLVQGADGNFYGTTKLGGSGVNGTFPSGAGTVFRMKPQGTVTILHNFRDGSVTNDGAEPAAGLIQGSDRNFYGTTAFGGSFGGSLGLGTVFQITPQGTVTILHSFSGVTTNGTDGVSPVGLVQGSDGNFYGTTYGGGSVASDQYPYGEGTVFQITPQGTVTILHNFGSVTNDGTYPAAPLIQGHDGNFYGTTSLGGSAVYGTVFEITPQGAVTILHNFGSVTNDGTVPSSPLIQSSAGNFYGVTSNGGVSSGGTVYSIVPTQASTHVPIYFGAAYALGAIYNPLSFTPKAAFGVSGSGAETEAIAAPAPPSENGFVTALATILPSWLLPQTIHKDYSTTNWTLVGSLPNYLSFDSTSGTISGTPTQPGTFTVTMTPNNAIGSGTSQTVTIYIDVPPGINSAVNTVGTVGAPFSYQIQATPAPDSYGATNLPGWLSADPVGGTVTGTPPAAGYYFFNAVAANLSGQTVQPVFLTVTGGPSSVPTIANPITASATVGTPFTFTIPATNGPTSYSALSVPPSLLFDPARGEITGLPSATGTFSIPVTATNAKGTYASVLDLTISILPSSRPAVVQTGGNFFYQIPVGSAVTGYGCGPLPAGLTFDSTTGVISGTTTATGSYAITVSATDGFGTGTGTLNLTVAAPKTYSQWQSANSFTGPATATPHGDGVSNLLKFMCNIDPNTPMNAADRAALPTGGITTIGGVEYLTLTYRQYALATDLLATPQRCSNLQTWANAPAATQIDTDPITGDPIMQVQIPATGSQFLRLNVTQP